MKISKSIPKFRFDGFTNDWEQRKLGEVSELYQPGTISTKELTEEGYPVFGANGYIGFYKAFNHQNSQVTVSARGEGAGTPSFVKGPVWITGNSMVVNIEKYRDFLEENYLYSYLQSQNLKVYVTGGAQPQITRNVLKKMDIHLVGIHEQQSIGSFFSTLDHLITLQQRELDHLKETKKTMLSELFPKKSETIPGVRFEGFTNDWEQRKLGKLCEITTGKLDANAMVEDGEFDFYTSGIKKYKIDIAAFEGPAITIAGNGATVGYMHYADGKFNAYQRTYVLNQFVADRRFLFSEIGKKLPIKIQQEARTGNIPYIVMDMLTGLDISIPLASEQQSIGSFFSTLDHLITLQQRKLDLLKSQKQTLLKSMFPR